VIGEIPILKLVDRGAKEMIPEEKSDSDSEEDARKPKRRKNSDSD
jgi:hypothetical protein